MNTVVSGAIDWHKDMEDTGRQRSSIRKKDFAAYASSTHTARQRKRCIFTLGVFISCWVAQDAPKAPFPGDKGADESRDYFVIVLPLNYHSGFPIIFPIWILDWPSVLPSRIKSSFGSESSSQTKRSMSDVPFSNHNPITWVTPFSIHKIVLTGCVLAVRCVKHVPGNSEASRKLRPTARPDTDGFCCRGSREGLGSLLVR